MTNLVTYASKANAVRGAKRMGLTDAEIEQVLDQVGLTFQIDKDKADRVIVTRVSAKHRTIENPHADATQIDSEADLDMIQMTGYSHCPHCGVHLDNGISDFDGMVDRHGSEKAAVKHQAHEWACLACGGEWGAEIVVKGSKARGPALRHYTNKSDAELKAKGGAVKVCWDYFIEHPEMKRKDAIAALVEQGVAFYTARTQYQKWYAAGGKKVTK